MVATCDAGDDFDEVTVSVSEVSAAGVTETVPMDAGFMGNSIAGLNDGMGRSGEEEECGASNEVMPVGFPNTIIPTWCAAGVIPEPSLLVYRHLFDHEAARAVFTSPTVIPSNSFGS